MLDSTSTPLRYGIASRTATYWNLYLGLAEGLYAAEGLAVEVVVTGGTRETVDALLEERVDLGGCSPDEVVAAVQRGADLAVGGGIVNRPVSWVVAQPRIRGVADLRGGRVGVNQTRGSVSMVLRAALAASGLGADDYTQVAVGSTPAVTRALREGRVDAAMLTAPFDADVVEEGFTPLLNVGDLFPRYAFTTLNLRRAWAEGSAATLAAFRRATRTAGARLADPAHRTDALRALADGTGLAGAALERSYAAYQQAGVLPRDGAVDRVGLEAVLEQMAAQGLLDGPPPPPERLLLEG